MATKIETHAHTQYLVCHTSKLYNGKILTFLPVLNAFSKIVRKLKNTNLLMHQIKIDACAARAL